MKEKIKSKRFWIALTGAIIVLLQAFGLKVDVPIINEIVTAVCSIAIILGVMIDDTKSNETDKIGDKKENTEQEEEDVAQ